MDKVLSARVDEEIIQKISLIANELNTSKKAVIENAIREYVKIIEKEGKLDLLELTCGTWNRDQTSNETLREIKGKFKKSMERYHK